MSAFQTVLLLSAALANSALGANPHLSISLKHGDAKERATERQLDRLLSQYDLSQWIFTTSVVIDEDAIPHSHPILTLHARHLKDDDLLLSTFVHEQAHWFFDQPRTRSSRWASSPTRSPRTSITPATSSRWTSVFTGSNCGRSGA
jgi:hypothetical protein